MRNPTSHELALVLLIVAAGVSRTTVPTAMEDRVTVDVSITPPVVGPGEAMVVRLTVHNVTPDTLVLGSPHSCFALPQVWADGERLAWEGTDLGCLTISVGHGIAAGGSRDFEWTLSALLQQDRAPWDYVVPAPRGAYRLVIDMHVALPNVERDFEVR